MEIEQLPIGGQELSEFLCPQKDVTYTKIEDYVLQSLNIDSLSYVEPDIFQRNFIYLMCNVLKDIREIENRLNEYHFQFNSIKDMKGLEAEYKRRKILYFCKINKEAHKEICSFLSDKIVKYLLATKYDMLKREDEKDFLSTYRQSWRYRYALHKKYYSYDYPFTAIADKK
ncbi:MAG: hypothetical protein KBI35_09970 [Ruminococcus sp.]|nr:hypothetical protein [Ruminococcus sp.]